MKINDKHIEVIIRQMTRKTDHLHGLKENVIMGRLVPAGTGLDRYKNIGIQIEGQEDELEVAEEGGGLVETSSADTIAVPTEIAPEGAPS